MESPFGVFARWKIGMQRRFVFGMSLKYGEVSRVKEYDLENHKKWVVGCGAWRMEIVFHRTGHGD